MLVHERFIERSMLVILNMYYNTGSKVSAAPFIRPHKSQLKPVARRVVSRKFLHVCGITHERSIATPIRVIRNSVPLKWRCVAIMRPPFKWHAAPIVIKHIACTHATEIIEHSLWSCLDH